MRASEIIKAFCRQRHRQSLVMPNCVPDQWWENDICQLTNAGLWIEYEVKVTAADFKADSLKCDRGELVKAHDGRWAREPGRTKHDYLANDVTCGPNRFYFIVPDELAPSITLPPFAGLIRANGSGRNIWFITQVKAPLRHKMDLSETVRKRIMTSSYYRFHGLNCKPQH